MPYPPHAALTYAHLEPGHRVTFSANNYQRTVLRIAPGCDPRHVVVECTDGFAALLLASLPLRINPGNSWALNRTS